MIPRAVPSSPLGNASVMMAALFENRAAEPSPWKILEAMKTLGEGEREVSSDPTVNMPKPML